MLFSTFLSRCPGRMGERAVKIWAVTCQFSRTSCSTKLSAVSQSQQHDARLTVSTLCRIRLRPPLIPAVPHRPAAGGAWPVAVGQWQATELHTARGTIPIKPAFPSTIAPLPSTATIRRGPASPVAGSRRPATIPPSIRRFANV